MLQVRQVYLKFPLFNPIASHDIVTHAKNSHPARRLANSTVQRQSFANHQLFGPVSLCELFIHLQHRFNADSIIRRHVVSGYKIDPIVRKDLGDARMIGRMLSEGNSTCVVCRNIESLGEQIAIGAAAVL